MAKRKKPWIEEALIWKYRMIPGYIEKEKDNPPVPPVPPVPPGPVIDDKIHAFLAVPGDKLTATFDCGTLVDGAEAKVDWGDGTVEDLTANTRMTHTYAAAGDYEVKISGMAAFKSGPYPGATVFFKEHLREVVLSNLMNSIGSYAFANCTRLTSITIPNSVISIGSNIFYGCTGLTSITVDPNNQTYYSEGNCLIQTSDKSLIAGCSTSIIPNDVTGIGQNAFTGCTGLTSVTIPDSVTSIGDYAFHGCTGLTSVTIGSSVTSIGYQAFYSCTSLTSVTIPDSVITIVNGAFSRCIGLTSVTIGSGVTNIQNSAFNGCSSLVEITFKEGRETIPTLYDNNTFEGLPADYKIHVQRDLLNTWKSADYWSNIADHIEGLPWTDEHIHGVVTTTAENTEVSFTPGIFIENVEHKIDWGDGIVEDLTADTKMTHTYATAGEYDFTIKGTSTITNNAFLVCKVLTSITIPNTVTSIGQSAFRGCSGLTSFTIPNSVTMIENFAFSYCDSLMSVTIPNSVTWIGEGAFENSGKLVEVIFENGREAVPTLSNTNAFKKYINNRKFYVQADLLDAWKAATNWSTYATEIEALPSIE